MRSVEVLKNKLSEYVRLAEAGETVLVLERALQPFPVALRTLNALHLAAMDSLRLFGRSLAPLRGSFLRWVPGRIPLRCTRPGKQRMELALALSTALSRTPAT
jgi:hypothetical protein